MLVGLPSPPSMSSRQLACAVAAGCVVGAFVSHRWRRRPAADDGDEAEGEDDHAAARARVWRAIGGAMTAAQLYVGDKLGLYYTVARLCDLDGFATSVSVAERAGLKVRWVREWLAQQAAAGFLVLLPGTGDGDDDLRYRITRAYRRGTLASKHSKSG